MIGRQDEQIGNICKIYDIARNDLSHLIPRAHPNAEGVNYVEKVSIDPDGVMPNIWKKRFKETCEQFADVITPNPGKYNGIYIIYMHMRGLQGYMEICV